MSLLKTEGLTDKVSTPGRALDTQCLNRKARGQAVLINGEVLQEVLQEPSLEELKRRQPRRHKVIVRREAFNMLGRRTQIRPSTVLHRCYAFVFYPQIK